MKHTCRTSRHDKKEYFQVKKLYMSRLVLFFTLVTGCLSVFSGCGYTLHGKTSLPFNSITIGKIVNRTFEPGLEDMMRLTLTDELIRIGFVIDGNSAYKIDGAINTFELRTLSTKQGLAVEYEVVITGDFRLTEPSGKTRGLRNSGAFITSFLSTESLQGVMAMKEKAIERALRDLSSEIAASIIYQ